MLEFAEAARQPVKAGRGADEVASALQHHGPGSLGIFQLLEGGDVLVGQRRVGQRPQMLGQVELGGRQ